MTPPTALEAAGEGGATRGPVTRAVLAVIRFYRTAITPSRPAVCRYDPTCSAYAVEAVETFGLTRGGWLAFRRLLRCHPFRTGGHDPVPRRVGLPEPVSGATTRSVRPAA